MAKANHGERIWLQVAIVILVIDGVAGSSYLLGTKERRLVKHFKKYTPVKTITSHDGDIIDCVDIYKQPAFDHPALGNHTIQMRPSDYLEATASANASSVASTEPFRMNGSCPEGTIPILRIRESSQLGPSSMERFGTKAVPSHHFEVAKLILKGTFYGASAALNYWYLSHVGLQDASSSVITLGRQTDSGDNFIGAGWTANQELYGDQKTRFTVYWTADGSHSTGCFNLNCPGFVQTSSKSLLGYTPWPNSVFGGIQREIAVTIYLDRQSLNWWVKYGDEPVGYWPSSIFKDLSTAEIIDWGGEVFLADSPGGGHHSATPMGNGYFPTRGWGKSAYVANILYRGDDNQDHEPDGAVFRADKPYCYDMTAVGMYLTGPRRGYAFYYGGNGQRPGCIR